ncbi:hypothetical protein NDU88_006371 [Pleurodeles waltl]|uniref:Uncharacterized protein n=1 Tax=Pleurodeles waltl TaxID=8319 RepID=A0AAV7WAE0_PLEWA|nr:hypothetical protein NDU88_006371 [Pleurodeles waltl]
MPHPQPEAAMSQSVRPSGPMSASKQFPQGPTYAASLIVLGNEWELRDQWVKPGLRHHLKSLEALLQRQCTTLDEEHGKTLRRISLSTMSDLLLPAQYRPLLRAATMELPVLRIGRCQDLDPDKEKGKMMDAIKSMTSGKAPGVYGFLIELFKITAQ